mmetsp:Transcript_30840/g.64390  ORF Transcript_30840/g.64390 Transcript_30840/m.64390 type:complete len:85 (+) Transcript_30840:174-428(+)
MLFLQGSMTQQQQNQQTSPQLHDKQVWDDSKFKCTRAGRHSLGHHLGFILFVATSLVDNGGSNSETYFVVCSCDPFLSDLLGVD